MIVTGYLHGGPYDGQTVEMSHAMVWHRLISWKGNVPSEDLYELSRPWHDGHQAKVHYEFVEPAERRAAA